MNFVRHYPPKSHRPRYHSVIRITYPGTGNYSTFGYDAMWRNVLILETTAGSVTSTKQFVWCGNLRSEERNNSGNLVSEYFSRGQTKRAATHFYTLDSLGSVRELISAIGSVEAQYGYEPSGQILKLQESLASDFQYANYYEHSRSSLNLAVFRAYTPSLMRWTNRDPIGESGSINLYSYVRNNPINGKDPTGLKDMTDYPFQNNCFGYSCGENRSLEHPWGTVNQPNPNETYGDFFSNQGWHCSPQPKDAPPCEKKCQNQNCNIVSLFAMDGWTGKGTSDMSNTPNDRVGFHTAGWNVSGYKGQQIPGGGEWSQMAPGSWNTSPTRMNPPPGGPSMWCCCKSKW